ncbi:MAG: glycosyltransferase family 39 protein [Muribaculaceae bacterium]|nr:glycosyltransferase family 39 protein [Muribaculaceae bacterium]
MKKILSSYQSNWLILLGVVSVTLIAFLGTTLYNTKGEPREAIVAVTMLSQGEWLLPINYGADIPFKPPMLAWLIAIVSQLNGGHVTEFISRIPSAIACVCMVMMGFSVSSRGRRQSALPMAMAVITFTAFEVERAATSCRVDMVLTAFIVCAIYFYYLYYDTRRWSYLIGATVMMALATLTKGPVGIILPSMIMWVWRLTRGDRFWPLTATMAVCALLALAPYAWWWVEAMSRGGDEFTRLMIEENFGRFTGTMSYSSHSNPWWYYFPMLAAGFLPYTLLALIGIPVVWSGKSHFNKSDWWVRLKRWYCSLEALDQVSLLAIVLTLAFYMIPDSKRGVYILPLYPFLAWGMAKYMRRLCTGRGRAIKIYACFIGILAIIAPLLLAIVMLDLLPQMPEGVRGILETIYNSEIEWWQLALIMLLAAAGVATLAECQRPSPRQALGMSLITTVIIYWSVGGVFGPIILNPKCMRPVAESLEQSFPREKYIYSMTDRLYELNYYLDDRMRLIEHDKPSEGIVVGTVDKLQPMRDSLPQYRFELVWLENSPRVDNLHKAPIAAWRFSTRGDKDATR